MKDAYDVLQQKYQELQRVRKEIEALHLIIPLLAEERDWVEHGLSMPPSSSLKPSQGQNVVREPA